MFNLKLSSYSHQNIHGTSIMKGLLSRVSGTNGFQLVNVTNAPIQLQPFVFQNQLLNMVWSGEGADTGCCGMCEKR